MKTGRRGLSGFSRRGFPGFSLRGCVGVRAAGTRRRRFLGRLALGHGFLIEGRRFPLLDSDGPLGTFPQARAQTVAVDVRDQPGLSINELDRALGAGRHALAASVAKVLIYPDDIPFHGDDSL